MITGWKCDDHRIGSCELICLHRCFLSSTNGDFKVPCAVVCSSLSLFAFSEAPIGTLPFVIP